MKKINTKLEKYIFPTGKLDIERLKILNEVYGKYSRNTFDRIVKFCEIRWLYNM